MITANFNGEEQVVKSSEEFSVELDRFDAVEMFELWLFSSNGPSIGMLRSEGNAWLIYLRHEGDNGFTSASTDLRAGVATYKLSNGQLDEYPLSFCIDIEQCYKALAYFFANDGAMPTGINWQES